jgi:hypothetical protein
MHNYIKQLTKDLEEVAKNLPAASFLEIPPHYTGSAADAELALTPYKTIEELTGINQKVFPEITQLEDKLWEQVNKAIFKVFESLNIELVDVPVGISPECLYEVLTTNWQHPVQHLPLSGMDLELCTGDPMTCPYGEYCDCSEEFDEFEIPVHFEKLIPGIARSIDAGEICYLNPETLEIEEIPKALIDDPYEFKMMTGYGLKNEEMKHQQWDEYYVFEPLESHESFKVMESFAENINDEKFRDQLYYALNHQRPFANFKLKIDNSQYRQNWFDYKQKRLEDHVKQIIWSEVNRISDDYSEKINVFYNDDGTKVDPESVPVPNLCVKCKKYLADNWEENLLCLMNLLYAIGLEKWEESINFSEVV